MKFIERMKMLFSYFIIQTPSLMEQPQEAPELFKLDEIDRKVFFWLIDHLGTRGLSSWIEYIAQDYKRKNIDLNPDKLLREGTELAKTKSPVALPKWRSRVTQWVQ